MKRITALLTAVCLLLCLTACGGADGENLPKPETTSPSTATQSGTATGDTPDTSDGSGALSGDSTNVSGESGTLTESSTTVSDPTGTTGGSTKIPDGSTADPQDRVTGTAHIGTKTETKTTRKTTTQKITTTQKPTTTRPTAAPLVDVSKKKLSVLIIGNSHSIDAFWLLYRAYKDQYPDTDLCVGILHYNGASIDEHIDFFESGEAVMRYYKNDTGGWEVTYNVTSKSVLTDQPWDVIMMQPGKTDLAEEALNRAGRHKLAEWVDRYVKHPHKFVWHVSWPNPNDETFFSPDYVRQPPKGYRDKLIRLYGFNPVNQFTLLTDLSRTWAVKDPLYSGAICSGTSVMHALLTQGMTQLDLWRDYTHLSDYGRLMVGYAITAQLTGEPMKEVGIDVIPVGWRHKQNKNQGPQTLTKKMKQVIVKAVNYSLQDPWHIPPQKYPVPTITTTTTTTTTTTRLTKPTVSATDPALTTERTTTAPTAPTTEESWPDSDCVLPTSAKGTKPAKTTD